MCRVGIPEGGLLCLDDASVLTELADRARAILRAKDAGL